ncbi:hypothetical protein ABK040_016303 [Willaertia magna]
MSLSWRKHVLLNYFVANYYLHNSNTDNKNLINKNNEMNNLNFYKEELNKIDQYINNNKKQFSFDNELSCLSPFVSKLVHEEQDENKKEMNLLIDEKNGLLNLNNFPHFLELKEEEEEEYIKASIQLKEICLFSWKFLNLDKILIENNNNEILKYLEKCNQPIETLQFLQKESIQREQCYSTFSFLCTIVERIISSIVITVQKHEDNNLEIILPPTLTEILECQQLRKVLSLKLLNIIKVFMGPPKGLNLRNVLFHGFLDEYELHSCYLSFLWRLYFTICKEVNDWCIDKNINFIIKPYVNLLNIETYQSLILYQNNLLLKKEDELIINKILESTYFILPTRKEIMKISFNYLFKGLKENNQICLQLSLCLLFPQFEHFLRRLYIISNNEKIDERTWSAQNAELFSTLDIIFSNHLESKEEVEKMLIKKEIDDLTPNEIYNLIGEPLGDCLLDSFLFYSGPRLRDKIAHCEVLNQIAPEIVQHYFLLFLGLCVKFTRNQKEIFELILNQSPLLSSTIHHLIIRNTPSVSVYDIRTKFINLWNETSTKFSNYIFSKDYKLIDLNFPIRELEEYGCLMNKQGFSLSKKTEEEETITTNKEELEKLYTNIENNFKTGNPKTCQFTTLQVLSYLNDKYPVKIGNIVKEKLLLQYNNHFHCLSQHISNIDMLFRILQHLQSSMDILEEKYQSICSLINERKARTPHRKLYTTIIETRPLINYLILFIFELIKVQYLHMDINQDSKKRLNWILQILTQAQRIEGAMKEGLFGACCSKFIEFIILKQKIIENDFLKIN